MDRVSRRGVFRCGAEFFRAKVLPGAFDAGCGRGREVHAVLRTKSYTRAPLIGVILRKLRHAGESVSTQFDAPVITMADDSTLRVRLDVDEADVSKLQVGQRAYVTAEAYGTHRFGGTVIRVGRILGKKNVRTDEPSEHVDAKILETLVQLDAGERLPLGLRVDSYVAVARSKTGD
ncbi:MAG TPA: HlyD family secretion protein [Candidatus Acidoferrum sp.]|nr:HlyD family secretion protein [Candidatus Acidoferrum sp.]